MKKLFAALFSIIMIISLVGCDLFGLNNNLIPKDFKVFDINLGGLTQEQFETTLKEAVDGYIVNITFDGVKYPVSGSEFEMKFNDSLDLSDAPKRIKSGELTAKNIEDNLFTIGSDETVKVGMLEAYSAYLEYLLGDMKSILEKEKKAKEETQSADAQTQAETSTAEEKVINPFYVGAVPTEQEIQFLQQKIDGIFDQTMAKIEFDEKQGLFVGKDGIPGETRDYNAAAKSLKNAILVMKKDVTVNADPMHSEGEKIAENKEMQEALNYANKFFGLKIDCVFNVPDGDVATETIDKSNISSLLYISISKRKVRIHEDQLTAYASELSDKYAKIETTDQDSDDGKVLTVKKGVAPDANQIFENILDLMKKQESGSFVAEYIEVNDSSVSEYGSLYVYVDLDAQKVTLYENGKAILETPCVSGCVSNGHSTIPGVYKIYYKQRNTTLRGPGYASFVKYWMPFNGGVGLHDADGWRTSYGGDYYIYGGSHGCINLPEKAAAQIYDKVQAGTKVVVVGGKQSTYRAVDKPVTTTAATTTAATTTAPQPTLPSIPKTTETQPKTTEPTGKTGDPTKSTDEKPMT